MDVSQTFSTVVRRTAIGLVLIALVALVQTDFQVHAQNAGNVGIYTREIPVFSAQSTTVASAFFPDFGFGCNVLSYQNSGFIGTIDFDWIPPGTSTPIILTQANYSSADSGTHTLVLGGYFPNLRSTVTPSAGSLNAEYTAQANGCSAISSGLGSNGAASPIVCDQNLSTIVPSAGTGNIVGGISAGQTIVICNAVVSFQAAPSNGTVLMEWAAVVGCTTPLDASWEAYTSAATPVYITIPMAQRSPFPASLPFACLVNNSGVSLIVSVSYARIQNL